MSGITSKLSGRLLDIENEKILKVDICIENGIIKSIAENPDVSDNADYIMPGFIDSHVHIESSMLRPSEFAKIAIRHGVTGVVTDPHEIANVLGEKGIDYMIDDSRNVRFNFMFGCPSCVPATAFETSGTTLDSSAVERLMKRQDIGFLSEMMNYPGLLMDDKEVWAKIAAAKNAGKHIDGHAPGLRGVDLKKYVEAGIETDHECSTLAEAEEKIVDGMMVQIREGSAAKNFDALWHLIDRYPEKVMMCTDDKHPDDLVSGYINKMADRAVQNGCNIWNALKASSVNAAKHYGIKHPVIKVGERAEFIVANDRFDVHETYIDGFKVFDEKGGVSADFIVGRADSNLEFPNVMNHEKISADDVIVKSNGNFACVKVIDVEDGQLYTKETAERLSVKNGAVLSSVEKDVLKIVVVNRYDKNARPAVAYIRGFGLENGAIASTIAHDSHNIISVGTDDDSIVAAVNKLIDMKGGIVAIDDMGQSSLNLPIAGLISDKGGDEVADEYRKVNEKVKSMGSPLKAPFMTLSFMALLVIPELKLSDKGLFDGNRFGFVCLKTE